VGFPKVLMVGQRAGHLAGCLIAGFLLCISSVKLTTFVAAHLKPSAPPSHGSSLAAHIDEPGLGGRTAAPGSGTALLGLCGAALVAAVARGRRVVMHGGQSGRFNVGQSFMPQLKGAKKMAVLRKRKNYGSHGARQQPRRYPLYDILEEIDEKIPWYTVVSEPEEPMLPEPGAPILERYPWAGELGGVPEEKQEIENDKKTALEPFFGSWVDNPPPLGRRQNYVFRRGWPRYNHPPWINRPLIGEGTSRKVRHDQEWSKDRGPKPETMTPRQKRIWEAKQQEMPKEAEITDEVLDELDEMDAALGALEEGS